MSWLWWSLCESERQIRQVQIQVAVLAADCVDVQVAAAGTAKTETTGCGGLVHVISDRLPAIVTAEVLEDLVHGVESKPGRVGVVRLLDAIIALTLTSVKAQYDKSCLSVVISPAYVAPQIE